MRRHRTARVLAVCVTICFWGVSAAHAQPAQPEPERRWNLEVAAGFDNSISGNINSGGIGTLNGELAAITPNAYEDVYGTGLHLRFGGGYLLTPLSEVRVMFSFQSLDADLTEMGNLGGDDLFAQYDDYQAFAMDVGYRRYHRLAEAIHAYGEGNVGIGFVDATDVRLVVPETGLDVSTDFFDQTTAFTLGFNVGVMVGVTERLGGFVQLGMRYTTGQGKVDEIFGTGLETINENTARWTIPFVVGVRIGLF